MSDQDLYERWKQARAQAAVPDGFADGVVARAAEVERRSPSAWMMTLTVFASTAFVVRTVAMLLVFVAS